MVLLERICASRYHRTNSLSVLMQWLLIALPDRKDEAMPSLKNAIENLTKEQLVELLRMASKNLVAMDGTWFQILEEREGMDYAMEIDIAVWERYPISEARRLKKFLNLAEYPGLEGLAQALPLYYNTIANETSMHWEDDALIFRTDVCRVQSARSRKGMEFHPCKPAGINEYTTFAQTIDPRIEVECLSCYPEITDSTCGCSWRFTLPSDSADKVDQGK